MDRKIFLEFVKNEFDWLSDLDYSLRVSDGIIYFEKDKENTVCSLVFHFSEYNDMIVHGVVSQVRFKKVEDLIESKIGHSGCTIKYKHDGKEINRDNYSILASNGGYRLGNVEDVRQFSTIVRDFYNNESVEFFKKYENLEDVGNWLHENEIQNHRKLISVSHNAIMLRKLIILKEINSDNFANAYNNYRSHILGKSEAGEKVYRTLCDTLLLFDDYFDPPSLQWGEMAT